MQRIKGFIFTLAGLFILVTLLSLLIPSKLLVSRGVVINANAEKVFAAVSNMHQWGKWQPAFKNNPAAVHYSTDSNTINSFCEWESNGHLNKFVIRTVQPMQITTALVREGENDVTNIISVLPLSDSNTVQVEWKALTKLKWYPWEKFYGIFLEKLTGQGYEDALDGLKDHVENGQ